MNVLQVHNYYQRAGGEDAVVANEKALLEAHGHRVMQYTRSAEELSEHSRLSLAASAFWNRASHEAVSQCVREMAADVVHFHNVFPLVSPSAYYAAGKQAAVVQTLHNYRLQCPQGLHLRNGKVCELCAGKPFAWPSVVYGCYRGSRAGSLTLASTIAGHRAGGTWSRAIDRYIALTEFARDRFVRGGLPADRVVVKPNGLAHDPGGAGEEADYALFIGRLSYEKGVDVLLEAWGSHGIEVPLRIVGSGPESDRVEAAARQHPHVTYLGQRGSDEVTELMKGAALLVLPSRWFEGLPMTLIESYATGLPVIASDIGALTGLVQHGRTGLLCPPDDPVALAAAVQRLWDNPRQRIAMSGAARAKFERHYTGEACYRGLLNVYEQAIEQRKQRAAT